MNKLDALWEYQQAELALEKIEARIKTTPSRQKLNKLHAFLSEQQTLITGFQKQIDARSASVDKLAAQIAEFEHQYELELAVRRELYDTLAWIEKATADYKETYAKAGKAKKEYDAVRKQCEDEIVAAQPELDAAKLAAQKRRAEVDPALLKKYDSVKTHHAVPMARVENNQCGGCNMSLPIATVKRVVAGTGLVECENCGRILYA